MSDLPLSGKHVVVGVTGGIAAYKACELVSRLVKQGAEVDVVMTQNATRFVAPLTFQTLSRRPVVTDTFQTPDRFEVEHVSLAKKADLAVVAPCTANMLAKMAHGLADDMLSTTLLATRAPVLVAPAMNTAMYEHPATESNMAVLRGRGVHFIEPTAGLLACGDVGKGRMAEAKEIEQAVLTLLYPKKDLAGKKVLVTAGAMKEMLDPVRYVSNRSTGKMGYALAREALRRGAAVTLLSGETALERPNCAVIDIGSTEELYQAMMRCQNEQDIIIQAAAPCDFTPRRAAEQKIKKDERGGLTLDLVPTRDVAQAVGQRKRPHQVLVGFAAETENLEANARKKLQKKNLDLIVLNDVSQAGAGFSVDTNIVTLMTQEKTVHYPLQSKDEVAGLILDAAVLLLGGDRGR